MIQINIQIMMQIIQMIQIMMQIYQNDSNYDSNQMIHRDYMYHTISVIDHSTPSFVSDNI